jgi:hypothetical protein
VPLHASYWNPRVLQQAIHEAVVVERDAPSTGRSGAAPGFLARPVQQARMHFLQDLLHP